MVSKCSIWTRAGFVAVIVQCPALNRYTVSLWNRESAPDLQTFKVRNTGLGEVPLPV